MSREADPRWTLSPTIDSDSVIDTPSSFSSPFFSSLRLALMTFAHYFTLNHFGT